MRYSGIRDTAGTAGYSIQLAYIRIQLAAGVAHVRHRTALERDRRSAPSWIMDFFRSIEYNLM